MAVGYNPRIVTNGLVLCLDAGNARSYPGSGTTWTDLSGNGNNCTLTNGPTFSTSNGGTIVFDGVNNGASSSVSFSLSNVTLEFWLRLDDTINWNTRFDIMNSGTVGQNGRFVIYQYSSTQISVFVLFPSLVANNLLINNANTIFTGKWKHFVITSVTNVSATPISIFIDGVLNTSTTINEAYTATNSSMSLMLSNDNVWPTKGILSSFKMYNRALSAAEIRQNFNALRGRYGI